MFFFFFLYNIDPSLQSHTRESHTNKKLKFVTYAEDLVQPSVGPVFAPLVFVSSYEPCSIESEFLVLLVFSTSSSSEFSEL